MFNCTVIDASVLSDNNIIIAGSARKSLSQSYPFIMKTDALGDTLWTRYYNNGHQAEKVIETFDGGYLFAYYTNGGGLMKLNAVGDSIWSVKIGNGMPYGIAETAEAVYLMVDNENDNVVMNSIGSSGEILWKRIFGGKGIDKPMDVLNASNGDDYLFAGTSFSDDNGDDFFVGLLDCFGYVNWTKTFGGPGTDLCYDLMESSDGHFIAVGSSNSFNDEGRFDFYVVKFDTYGNKIWEQSFPGPDNEDYFANHVFETSYGSYMVTGPKMSHSGTNGESYLVEFKDNSSSAQNTKLEQNPLLNIQPNPSDGNTIIKFDNPNNDSFTIRILDQQGSLIKQIENIRKNTIQLNSTDLPPGIYFVELSGKTTSRAKMLIR